MSWKKPALVLVTLILEVNETNLQDEQFPRGFRQRVGFVFQNSDTQLFSATVWDEVAFGPLQMGFRGAPPYKLSSGEKKKVVTSPAQGQ